MAQGVVFALKTVAIEGVGIPVLAIKAIPGGKVMVFGRGPGKLYVGVAAGKPFDARRLAGRGSVRRLLLIFLALRHAAKGFHAQYAIHQWAAGVELTIPGIAAIAFLLDGSVSGERAGPLLTNLFGNNVDHPAQCIGTIQRGHRAAYHFNTLDGVHRDPVKVKVVMAEHRVAGVNALAVNQDQGVATT